MTPPSISQAHLRAAERVFTNLNGKIVARLGTLWPPAEGAQLVAKVCAFLQSNLKDLANRSFGLRLKQTTESGGDVLSPQLIAEYRRTGDGIDLFTIGSNLNVLEHEKFVPSEARSEIEFMQEASKDAPVFFYEHRGVVRVFARDGYVMEFSPASGAPAGKHSQFARPAHQYEEMLREHYEQWVKNDDHSLHWEDHKKRILCQKLGKKIPKTEEIFQRSIIQWLNTHLTDAHAFSEPRKASDDRADVLITGFGGGFFLVEVKWMGTNGHSTLDLERVQKGLKQLGQYLSEVPTPELATLVAYDGRDKSKFDCLVCTDTPSEGFKKLAAYDGVSVPAGGSCFVFFLFSERASELK